jgi:uncharacterized coiled-coil protein SlyX
MNNPQLIPKSAEEHFVSLMDRYEKYVQLAGKKVRRAPPEKTRAIFRDADDAQKERMITRLESEISIFEDTLGAGEPLENGSRQLWRYLLKRRLVPCSDLFDKIGENDTIQVFGADLRLLFASLNFFDHVSFTLEQILAETWQSAVARDAHFVQQLVGDFGALFSSKTRHTIEAKTPPHLVEEVDTESLIKSTLHVKWMSPAYFNDEIECGIFVVGIDNL